MKTTIDLPDDLLERTKIAAAKRRSTLKKLVIEGLESVLADDGNGLDNSGAHALERLKSGFHLGGKPLSREESHAR